MEKKMSKKQEFIKMVEYLLTPNDIHEMYNEEQALAYFESLKLIKETQKVEVTENGKNIILFMQSNEEVKSNLFYAKDIAEGMFVSSKVISGAMRKLVTDGYVEKMTESPIVYAITDKGRQLSF